FFEEKCRQQNELDDSKMTFIDEFF
ncbi:MAG: hypothetical protein ACI80S_001835, partial [Pseudohongiellaceae bacterium]